MTQDKIIENVPNVLCLMDRGILTEDEIRKMLELKPKTPKEIEVNGETYKKKEN